MPTIDLGLMPPHRKPKKTLADKVWEHIGIFTIVFVSCVVFAAALVAGILSLVA